MPQQAKLTEGTVNLMMTQIQNNIAGALANVRADVNNPVVTTESPRSYFIYPKAHGYRGPAVFVIADNIDFRKEQRGANFISAVIRVNVTVMVEDRNAELLTRRAWRYQSALYQILDETQLVSADNKLKIVIIVKNARYSPTYTTAKDPSAPEGIFRQEVMLECDVEHWENF